MNGLSIKPIFVSNPKCLSIDQLVSPKGDGRGRTAGSLAAMLLSEEEEEE
jgi:hypothetical protein